MFLVQVWGFLGHHLRIHVRSQRQAKLPAVHNIVCLVCFYYHLNTMHHAMAGGTKAAGCDM